MTPVTPIDVDRRTREESLTLKRMRRVIPAEYFRPNALRSWWGLLRVLGSIAACVFALSRLRLAGPALVWEIPATILIWFVYGWSLVGLFVIGHDCGHGSFSRRAWVNTLVGHACMAPLWNSFRSWKLTHNDHHANTLLRGGEVDWASRLMTREEFESTTPGPDWITRAGYAAPFGIVLWILWNTLRRGFHPRGVLSPGAYAKEKNALRRSSAIATLALAAIYGGLWWGFGFWGMLKLYGVPAAIALITGYVIITIQHANARSLVYDKEGWTPFRGQMVSTFDVRFPTWLESLWFDINIHIPHHLASQIPWYYLKPASGILRRNYPAYCQEQVFGLGHLSWWYRTPFLKKAPGLGYYALEPAGRRRNFRTSRLIIAAVVLASIGTLAIKPGGAIEYAIDVLLRTYVMFLGTVMAHEGVHGCLGRGRAANVWWGRIALLPVMVPFTNFRKTHLLHHAFTNIPDKDPDYFVRPRNIFEIPFRAVAVPHHWLLWLWKRGRIRRTDLVDLALNFAGVLAVYAAVLWFAGWERILWGMVPPLILVSMLLWYPFAARTHEGFSTGSPETRSHNYYGRFMYWFSLGLSMHRAHHTHPRLTWIELKAFVEENPNAGFWSRLLPHRDMHVEGAGK